MSHPPLGHWLARIIASWWHGDSVLPAWLGLTPDGFEALLARHFPGLRLPEPPRLQRSPDPTRGMERDSLIELFLMHATLESPDDLWLARILADGSMGDDHLWQDLGLWSREDVSGLLRHGFAALANRNTRDMKWKKFFYKQLCEAEHLHLCQAPSCAICRDYDHCFGPET
ncbi:MAG: nitrogen fixation protein NifQ [Magnetococcales bacterium]|nr:nitrogen fixation protein NifQ [Magnetococcales bacterium]